MALTPAEIATFRERGFVVLDGMVTDAEIDAFLGAGGDPLPTGHAQPTLQRHKRDPSWAFLAGHPRLVPRVRELLGGAPRVLQTMYIPKPPAGPGEAKNGVALHRDQLYIRAEPPKVAVCWIAINDTDPGNGGLRVVPGSHRWPLSALASGNGSGLEIELSDPAGKRWVEQVPSFRFDRLPEEEVETLTVPRGGAVIFDGKLIHGSATNPSTTRERLAFATHYVREDAWVYRAELQDTAVPGELVDER